MSKYTVLFDGNGSRLIRIVGVGDYVPVADLVEVEAARDAMLSQLCGLLNSEGLQRDLVIETERAISQRDEYLKTKVSTAGNGGSHDTCFPAILREHIRLNADHIAEIKAKAVEAAADYMMDYLGIARDVTSVSKMALYDYAAKVRANGGAA